MVSPTAKYPFLSEVDRNWYFWIGSGLQGPFDDYNEAHEELTRYMEDHGKEEDSQESKA